MGQEDQEELFDMNWTKIMGRTSRGGDWFSIRFHLNPQIRLIKKSVYTAFDFIRDIGGLTFAAIIVASLFASMFTYNKLEN